jgi:hypothetical protein
MLMTRVHALEKLPEGAFRAMVVTVYLELPLINLSSWFLLSYLPRSDSSPPLRSSLDGLAVISARARGDLGLLSSNSPSAPGSPSPTQHKDRQSHSPYFMDYPDPCTSLLKIYLIAADKLKFLAGDRVTCTNNCLCRDFRLEYLDGLVGDVAELTTSFK